MDCQIKKEKLRTSNFVYARSYDRSEQKAIKNFGKSTQGTENFRAPIYTTYRAVIFAVAQLSCFTGILLEEEISAEDLTENNPQCKTRPSGAQNTL